MYAAQEITEEHNKMILNKEREINELMQEIKGLKEIKELEESKDKEINELRAITSSIQMKSEGVYRIYYNYAILIIILFFHYNIIGY